MVWSLTVMLAACLLQVIGVSSNTTPEWELECFEWNNVTRTLNSDPDVELVCNPNHQCSGFDCTGVYSYQGYFSVSLFTVHFCYGIQLLQCEYPLAVFFYISFPDKNDQFSETVHNSTFVQIPNLSYDMRLGTADGFVSVDMTESRSGWHRFVELEMIFKVRLKTSLFETWPSALQRTLLPRSILRVPPCYTDQRNHPSPPPIATCGNLTIPASSTSIPASSTNPYTTPLPVNGTTVKSCNGHYGQCKHLEKCRKGNCVCMLEYHRDGSGSCVRDKTYTTTVTPIDEPYPDSTTKPPQPSAASQTGLSKITMTIVGCVIGVVLIAGAILTIFIVRYKRHQARYGQHELLVNNDDDDPTEVNT